MKHFIKTKTKCGDLRSLLVPNGSVFSGAWIPFSAQKPDAVFLVTTLALSLFGTIMVFSAGYAYAAFRYHDATFFVRKQILWWIIGVLVLFLGSHIHPRVIEELSGVLYLSTVLLLILVLVIGFVGNGAQRWIAIGPVMIQPSEIAKFTLVLMLARYFSVYETRALDRTHNGRIFWYGTVFPAIFILVVIALVMLQKHLSCMIILGLIGVLVMLSAGIGGKYISLFAAIGGLGIAALAFFTDYTKERITVWQDPEAYPLTGGWQTLQGLMAIGSGGMFGLGLGKSILKHCYISEPANDMIFAVLCEELGFFGALALILLFGLLVYRGYTIALRAETVFSRLVVFGITTKIAVQTLLNIAVVTNTIPNTGISLPFFSYGGSSLIMLFFEMGIVLSISRFASIQK